MPVKPYGSSGIPRKLFEVLRDNCADPRGMSSTQIRDAIGLPPKRISCVLAEAIQRGLIGAIKRHPYSRYYVSQAMADQCAAEAAKAMEDDAQARRPRTLALADQIRAAFVNDSEALLINELLARLPGDPIYMSRMVTRLLSSGGLHAYGPAMRHRYSREKLGAAEQAAIDSEEAEATLARKQRKAERQRARLVKDRPAGAEPLRKTAKERATMLAGTKSAKDLGLQPPRSKPVARPMSNAHVVIPDNVVRIERAAPPDMRYHVDPSHRGEFSQQWQQLRAAA